jgi:hypothetical protein
MRGIIGGEDIPRRDKLLKLQGAQAALFSSPPSPWRPACSVRIR